VCAPLCFLVIKIGRLDNKSLKSLLSDYYSTNDIVAAKEKLIDDANRLQLSEKPLYVLRVTGTEMVAMIVRLTTCSLSLICYLLDEKNLLFNLPTYVVDKPDQMPSPRLLEGDLKYFMHMFERLTEKVDQYRNAVSTLSKHVHTAISQPNGVPRVIHGTTNA